MLNWLKEMHGNRASVNKNERIKLNNLREEVKELREQKQALVEDQGLDEGDDEEAEDDDSHQPGSEMHSETDEDDDVVEDLPISVLQAKKNMRTSVSAEAFGVHNKKEDFTPPVINKSEESKKEIAERLRRSFMFQGLSEEEMNIVVGAMDIVYPGKREFVIKEGDDGDCMYVLEKGKLKAQKYFGDDQFPTVLKEYEPGDAFGELALLYNAPRAASVMATEDCTLYKLDRGTFNHIVKDAAQKKREKYEEFLKMVDILKSMDEYERSKLADAFKDHEFKPGEFIIKEGEAGSIMFFIAEGTAHATKTLEAGKAPVEVKKYQKGDYFGEMALLKNEP